MNSEQWYLDWALKDDWLDKLGIQYFYIRKGNDDMLEVSILRYKFGWDVATSRLQWYTIMDEVRTYLESSTLKKKKPILRLGTSQPK